MIYKEHESRLERERNTAHISGFVEGVEATKEIIIKELKDAIQNGTIVIERGADKVFEIVESVGDINK